MSIMGTREILDNYVAGFDPRPWMLTANGKKLIYDDPQPEQIILPDIAHHLSMIVRYTGALSRFYSVAQHCLMCTAIAAEVLNSEEPVRRGSVEYYDQLLAVLLHDAEEAYINDLSSPLKSALSGRYRWIANGIRQAIYSKYGVDWSYHNDIVKQADLNALLVERYYFMPESEDWPKAPRSKLCVQVEPPLMMPEEAEVAFYSTVVQLITDRDLARAQEAQEA